MTESQALDLLLEGHAVIFPDGFWRIYGGERDDLYIWRFATDEEAEVLGLIARTAGIPGPADATA